MAGILDQYFARPGSGIFGGLFDDPGAAPISTADPQTPPGLDANMLRAALLPTSNPMFAPLADTQRNGFANSASAVPAPTAAMAAPGPEAGSFPTRLPNAAVPSSPLSSTHDGGDAAQILADMTTGKDAASGQGGDFLSRLGNALHDNSSMLMALGGGMMTGGLGKGFQAAAGVKPDAAPPQTIKVRRPGGGDALLMWDQRNGRYVPIQVPGLT